VKSNMWEKSKIIEKNINAYSDGLTHTSTLY